MIKLSEIKLNPNNPRIKDCVQICGHCKIEFKRKSIRKFCCKACYAKSLVKLKICPVCSKEYPSDPNTKFCSVSCYKIGRKSIKGKYATATN